MLYILAHSFHNLDPGPTFEKPGSGFDLHETPDPDKDPYPTVENKSPEPDPT